MFRRSMLSAAAVTASLLLTVAPAYADQEYQTQTIAAYNDGDVATIAFRASTDAAINIADHVVVGKCSFKVEGDINSNNATVYVVGEATASTHVTPVATGLKCVLNTPTGVFTISGAAPGSAVVVAGSVRTTLGPVSLCAHPEAYWNDTHFIVGPVFCV